MGVTNIVGFISTMAALLGFRKACYMDLPEEFDNTMKIEWSLGPGFRCLMAATIIKIIDLVCHCVLPTPEERWRSPGADMQDVTDYMKMVGAPVKSMANTEADPSPYPSAWAT